MPRLKNIENQRFGKLTALFLSNKKDKWGGRYWVCRCDCGVEKEIYTSSLLSGRSKSCGFCRDRSSKIADLAGKTFGSWTVLEEAGRTKNQQVRWLCRCSCGTERVVSGIDLTSGKSKTCGCSRKHRFGKESPGWKGGLTIIGRLVRNHLARTTTWVQDVFARDNYTCRRCGERGGRLQAHHLIELSKIIINNDIETIEDISGCDLLFDLSNGICLCEKCHRWVHTKKNTCREYLTIQ